jgi:disulfide bond formation protein DsbB
MAEQTLLNTLTQTRVLNIAGLATGIGAMTYAYYLQYYEYLAPCPLCIFDRVFLLGILICLLIAAAHNPSRKGQRIYACFVLLFSCGGLISSGRHVWLQHLPADQVPSCGPGLNYLLDAFPLGQALEMVLRGSGECAEIAWQFFGLTLPEVTLFMFLSYLIFCAIQLFRSDDAKLFPKF